MLEYLTVIVNDVLSLLRPTSPIVAVSTLRISIGGKSYLSTKHGDGCPRQVCSVALYRILLEFC